LFTWAQQRVTFPRRMPSGPAIATPHARASGSPQSSGPPAAGIRRALQAAGMGPDVVAHHLHVLTCGIRPRADSIGG
jgi:hypothetical protein